MNSINMGTSSGALLSMWQLKDPGYAHLIAPQCKCMPSTLHQGREKLLWHKSVSHCCFLSLSWSLSQEPRLTAEGEKQLPKLSSGFHMGPTNKEMECSNMCQRIDQHKAALHALYDHQHATASKAHFLPDRSLCPAVLRILELLSEGPA